MSTATPGRIVYAVVPRHLNGGQDHAPAVITAAGDDDQVEILVFRRNGVTTVETATLVADRDAAVAFLDERTRDLPGAHVDDDGKPVPGTNPISGKPWHRSDVAAWDHVAYWPTVVHTGEASPAPVDEWPFNLVRNFSLSAEPPVRDAEARRAELLAELEALDAQNG